MSFCVSPQSTRLRSAQGENYIFLSELVWGLHTLQDIFTLSPEAKEKGKIKGEKQK